MVTLKANYCTVDTPLKPILGEVVLVGRNNLVWCRHAKHKTKPKMAYMTSTLFWVCELCGRGGETKNVVNALPEVAR